MKSRNKSRVMSTVALVATFVMAGAGVAIADESSSGSSGSGSLGSSGAAAVDPLTFDGWGTCPIEDLEVTTCASVVVRGGTMKLGALSVPIPDGSLKVAGGVKYATQPDNSFIETFVAKQDGPTGGSIPIRFRYREVLSGSILRWD